MIKRCLFILLTLFWGVGLGVLFTNAEANDYDQSGLCFVLPFGFKIPINEQSRIGIETRLFFGGKSNVSATGHFTGICYEYGFQ